MKQIVTFTLLLFSVLLKAQEPFSPQTVPPHAHTEKCYAGILHQKLMAENPDYALRMNQFETYMQSISGSDVFYQNLQQHMSFQWLFT